MENNKQADVMAILKLYELRRDPALRQARRWYFTQFRPACGKDIVRLDVSGERTSANFRMVTSFWDMACSFVNNGALDSKIFADANTEHIFVYAIIQPHLAEVRELFGEPDYLENLEKFVLQIPGVEKKLENRRRLMEKWTTTAASESADFKQDAAKKKR